MEVSIHQNTVGAQTKKMSDLLCVILRGVTAIIVSRVFAWMRHINYSIGSYHLFTDWFGRGINPENMTSGN